MNDPSRGGRLARHGSRSLAPRRRRAAGFTLLEVLTTLVILAMVLAMLYGVLISTLKTRDRIEDALVPVRIAPALAALLEADFSAAFLTSDNETTACFVGQDNRNGLAGTDRVDFVSTRTAHDAERQVTVELSELGYQVADNPDRSGWFRLYRRESAGADDKPTTGGALVPVYDLVKSFDVQFSDGEAWVEAWNSKEKKGLPKAVQVTLLVGIEGRSQDGGQPPIEERQVQLFIPLPR